MQSSLTYPPHAGTKATKHFQLTVVRSDCLRHPGLNHAYPARPASDRTRPLPRLHEVIEPSPLENRNALPCIPRRRERRSEIRTLCLHILDTKPLFHRKLKKQNTALFDTEIGQSEELILVKTKNGLVSYKSAYISKLRLATHWTLRMMIWHQQKK